jgi:hypothetical protein
MPDERRSMERVAWYALGLLEGEEKAEVEQLLERSAEARALLSMAREQAELLPETDLESALNDVHPRLLVEYAEDPDSLDFETRRWVEQTLSSSATSREALAALREVRQSLDAGDAPAPIADSIWRRAWSALSDSLLAPLPALAYLVVAGVLVGWVVTHAPEGVERAPLMVTQTRDVVGQSALRDDAAAPGLAPLELRAPTLLRLRTGLRPGDLTGEGLSFDLELARGGTLLWSERRDIADFDVVDGSLAIQVLLDPATLEAGVAHELRLVARWPGNVLDGAALFRRSLVPKR